MELYNINLNFNHINSLPSELNDIICNNLTLDDLINTIKTSKSNNNISESAKNVKNQYIIKINNIKHEIIKIFSLDKIKTLQITSIELFNLIEPFMDFIHNMNKYILCNWSNDDNYIIKYFVENYITHYINKQKIFIKMDIDRSFVTSIMMNMYH